MTLRVKLEIVPFGDEDAAHEIGRLDIFNKGPIEFGHHAYGIIETTPSQGFLHQTEVWHRRDLGAWELVRTVLLELDTERP